MELNEILTVAIKGGASDIHLKAGLPPMFRVDGTLVPLKDSQRLAPEEIGRMAFSIMNNFQKEQFKQENELDLAYGVPGLGRFRVNVFMQRGTVGIVFRVIPFKILTIDQLNLPKVLETIAQEERGLILVTGTTGSGKSTTLAAMIDFINTHRTSHIITIEDPIEFVHPPKKCLVNQRQVGVHTDGFKAALRAALREDPDVILVGELRDLETVEMAIETAETGHLVFGTLHTTTAASTVDRIIDQFPADRQAQIRVMLSESLRAVIAQSLLPRKGGGRIAAHEILLVNASISNLIREGKTFQIESQIQTGKKYGMQTLNDDLLRLIQNGLVEAHEAYLKAVDKRAFREMCERNGIQVG
jgi:twitching motility protein PilT